MLFLKSNRMETEKNTCIVNDGSVDNTIEIIDKIFK